MAADAQPPFDDVNAKVRKAVDPDGDVLFRIGLSLAEIPKS